MRKALFLATPILVLTVLAVARASRPGLFSQDMSGAAFSDSVFSVLDIPFPPEELWCVILERKRSPTDDVNGKTTYDVVFVGLHRDTWNVAWVVHEGLGNLADQALRENVATVGCDLGLVQAE